MKQAAAPFAALCAVGIPLWWAGMFRVLAVRQWFVPEPAWPALQSVMPADFVLAIVTGILAARLFQGRASVALGGVVFGGWLYATAYTIGWAIAVNAPPAGPLTMIVALAGFGLILYDMVSTRGAGAA